MKVAVVSLKFSPGHMTHLRAYRELFKNLADDVCLFIHPEYKKFMGDEENIIFTDDVNEIVKYKPDLVYIYNISTQNVSLLKKCEKQGIKTRYVLHEPQGSLKELKEEGHNIVKTIGAWTVNANICRHCDKVILASETGRKNYERYMIKDNKSYSVFPLIFCDEYEPDKTYGREYFAFIGGFMEVHGSKEFMKFVEYALKRDKDIKFLIATRVNVDEYLTSDVIKEAVQTGRLKIQAGRPMTTEEINGFYRQSICVWNAYNRSTQSGVLPNALMQGAPVIVNNNGAAKEVMKDKTAGCFINMPPNNEQVYQSYLYIKDHLADMEASAREIFLQKYFYMSQLELARKVILE